MFIKILKSTAYRGRTISPGQILEIDETTAKRWVDFKIAAEALLSELKKDNLLKIAADLKITVPNNAKADEIISLIEAVERNE